MKFTAASYFGTWKFAEAVVAPWAEAEAEA